MARVLIYGKGDCPYTAKARREYLSRGHSVDYRDVVEDPAQLAEMLRLSGGKRTVPVIVEDGKVTVGFAGEG